MSAAVLADRPFEMICRASDADWHSERTHGIGASEAACLIGENPWKSTIQLYAEKVGALPPPDLSDNEAVFWGTRLESVVRDVYGERTRRYIDEGGILLRSTVYPWALATLDGWTSDSELGPYWPLEVKTTGAARGDDWLDGPPRHYVVQVHWQMLVTGAPKATVACLIGGQRLVWADVERDEMLIRKLVRAGEDFWRRVQEHDAPAPDGTQSAAKTLGALYPDHQDEIVILGGDLLDVADELELLKGSVKKCESRKVELENQIKAALGPALRGVLPDGRAFEWATEDRAEYTVKASKRRVLRAKAAK